MTHYANNQERMTLLTLSVLPQVCKPKSKVIVKFVNFEDVKFNLLVANVFKNNSNNLVGKKFEIPYFLE